MSVLLLLFLLLSLGAVTFFLLRARGPRARRFAGPGYLHPAIRILNAVAGVGILLALAVVTMRDARNAYRPPAGDDTLAIPVASPPLAQEDLARDGKPVPPERAAVRASLVVVEPHGGTLYPLAAKTLAIDWPADKGRAKDMELEAKGCRYDLSLLIERLYPWGPGVGVSGDMEFRYAAKHARGTHGGGVGALESTTVMTPMPPRWGRADFKVFSLAHVKRSVQVPLVYISAAPGDDAFRSVPASEWVTGHRKEVVAALARDARLAGRGRQDSPALAFLSHFGPNALLLALTTVSLSLLFKRRLLAWAGACLAVVLFTIGTERAVFHLNARYLAEGTPQEQRVAAEQIRQTFFFREEAEKVVAETATTGRARKTTTIAGDGVEIVTTTTGDWIRVVYSSPSKWIFAGVVGEGKGLLLDLGGPHGEVRQFTPRGPVTFTAETSPRGENIDPQGLMLNGKTIGSSFVPIRGFRFREGPPVTRSDGSILVGEDAESNEVRISIQDWPAKEEKTE